MKIRSKCVGEVRGLAVCAGAAGARGAGAARSAHPGPAYMSMATMTLVRAAMIHAVTNM